MMAVFMVFLLVFFIASKQLYCSQHGAIMSTKRLFKSIRSHYDAFFALGGALTAFMGFMNEIGARMVEIMLISFDVVILTEFMTGMQSQIQESLKCRELFFN